MESKLYPQLYGYMKEIASNDTNNFYPCHGYLSVIQKNALDQCEEIVYFE